MAAGSKDVAAPPPDKPIPAKQSVRGRGRRKGSIDQEAQDRYQKIRAAFGMGEKNKTRLAKRFKVNRRTVDRALDGKVDVADSIT